MREGSRGARRFSERIVLTRAEVVVDDFGHAAVGEAVDVLTIYAEVRQMSAVKSMMTFQQADVVGVDIVFRKPSVEFNGIRWNGREIVFSEPIVEGKLMRDMRVTGYYQIDNPLANG